MLTPRQVLIIHFKELLSVVKLQKIRVLVLGGSNTDPEVKILREFFHTEIYYSSLEPEDEPRFFYLDLNDLVKKSNLQFDFILCSQVLEHVWNFNIAALNIRNLLKPKGIAWITVPANNFPHGSPDYYIAGFSETFLVKLFESVQLDVLTYGTLSNKRVALYRSLLRIWPDKFQLQFPFFAYYAIEGNFLRKIQFNIVTFFSRLTIAFASPKYTSTNEFPIESWVALQKNLSKLD